MKTEMKYFGQLCFMFVSNLRISPGLISKTTKLISSRGTAAQRWPWPPHSWGF